LLVGGILVVVAATYAQERLKPEGARTLLHVARVRPSVLRPTANQEAESDFETYKRTQAVLVKSRLVLNAAMRDARVADLPVVTRQADPIEWLEKLVEVSFPDNGEVMRIEVRLADAKESLPLADAVTDAYLREIVNAEKLDRTRRLDTLRAALHQYDRTLRNKRNALRTLAEAAGTTKSDAQELAEEFRGDLRKAIREAGLGKIDLQAQLNRLKAVKNPGPEQQQSVEKLEEQIAVQTERQKLLKEELDRMTAESRQLGVKAVDLDSFKDEIASAEAMARKVQAEVEQMTIELNAPARVQLLDRAVSRAK
jgi:hypothetical protein